MRRVFVTGIGSVSPFGSGVDILLDSLYKGKSAVKNMKEEWGKKINDLNCWVGAPLKESIDDKIIPRKFRRFMGPTAVISISASQEALKDSGIPENEYTSGKIGVSFSSTMGSVVWLENYVSEYLTKATVREISSGIFFKIMSHTCAANIAHFFNIQGRTIAPNAACASSALAIGLGYEAIQNGKQDIMLCGGADELHVIVNASFDNVQAASTHFNDTPSKTPRPFDRNRDGTVCGEGAGVLILESEESAIKRNAKIYAEIIGFATAADGTHLAEPHSESITKCIQSALENAQIAPENIDYINAHATGTVLGDEAEAQSIKTLFGENSVAVSSFKGYMGHTLGASAVLETIASIKMMNENNIIPTLNLDEIDEGCKNINHITKLMTKKINIFLKNSFAFGGINTVLVLKRYQND